MKFFFAAFIILAVFSCKKTKQKDDKAKTPVTLPECGTLLTVPVLDSFVYPTCYITAIVAFPREMKQCIFITMSQATTMVHGFLISIIKTVLIALHPDFCLQLSIAKPVFNFDLYYL